MLPFFLHGPLILWSFGISGGTTCVTPLVIIVEAAYRNWSDLRNACIAFGLGFCAYLALTCYAERRIRNIISGKIFFDDDHSASQVTTLGSANTPTELPSASAHAGSSVAELPEESRYSYQPLLGSEIRLLKIHPSENSDTNIQVDLVHVPLNLAQQQDYIALSYTWGDAHESEWIRLNDTFFIKVRPNLFDILKRLRSMKCTNVWIDAICANQSDKIECNTQVLRMKSIYAGARKVVVALAPMSTENTEQLVNTLSDIQTSLPVDSQAHKVSHAAKGNLLHSTLNAFCINPYWTRIWIVQEFAIGHEVEFLIQDRTFAAEKVEILLRMVEIYQPDIYTWQVRAIFAIRDAWHANKPFHLMRILELTSYSACTLRHDRIFGILGLAPDSLKYLSEPNYEMGLEDIAISIAQFYIKRNSADFMFLARGAASKNLLPSWCPDLFHFDRTAPDDRTMRMLGYRTVERLHPCDPIKWNATAQSSSDILFRGKSLLTSAVRLGNVQSLGFAWSDPVECEFPVHQDTYKRRLGLHKLLGELHGCFSERESKVDHSVYSYLKVFTSVYGSGIEEDGEVTKMVRWIYRNRSFVAGDLPLEAHAARLKHPISHEGLIAWHWRHVISWIERTTSADYWSAFEHIAKKDMRLMCVIEKGNLQFGWAPNGARLYDEVFLIPGCSSPAILRSTKNGAYQFIGEAIVVGAMDGEAWERLTPEDFQQIEIV